MGIVSKQLSQSNNMKFLLVLAVAAYARAEADPGFAYSVGAAPLVYNHLPVAYHHPLAYHHVPLVYAAAAGCRNNEGSLVPCSTRTAMDITVWVTPMPATATIPTLTVVMDAGTDTELWSPVLADNLHVSALVLFNKT